MASRIGELLIRAGIIDELKLEEALRRQKENGLKLGEILIELGYITTRDLVCMLSEQVSISFVELKPEMLDFPLIRKFPERILYELCVLPLYEADRVVFVAIGDPTNLSGIARLIEITKREVVVSGADPQKILRLLDQIFLSEVTEPILNEIPEKKTIVIEITDQTAIIQRTGYDGQITKKTVPATVIINLGKEKPRDSNEPQ
jgi:type IV pilus assembly protein PilB